MNKITKMVETVRENHNLNKKENNPKSTILKHIKKPN